MNKRVLLLFSTLLIGLQLASASSAFTKCSPTVTLINQDPYPANPGEYVKVVFQIDGLSNPDCQQVTFELKDSFPFSVERGQTKVYEYRGGVYARDFSSSATAPYKLRVDKDAINGANKIEGILKYARQDGGTVSQIAQFDIEIEGVKVDFEISIKDFDSKTNTLTFEILNIGENDVEALVVEVPKQENIVIKGSNKNIIGTLDSNDDTTFKFEALPKDGEIELAIAYTDPLKVRRTIMKKVYYDSSYFTDRKADEARQQSTYFYLFWALVIILILFWIKAWWKKKKKREKDKRESERR